MPASAGRRVLENVPPVGFYHAHRRHPLRGPAPEDVPLVACVTSCLNYLGEGMGTKRFYMPLPRVHPGFPGGVGAVDATYTHLMGATGAAFRLSWKPGWHGDNVATFLIGEDVMQVFDRAFAEAGRRYTTIGSCSGMSADDMRRAIIESIDGGMPVIAHGVIGPPEECLITGYDEGGDVLIGWNFFQDDASKQDGEAFEAEGQFRKRNWEADTWDVMVIGEQVDRPALADRCLDAIRWAVEVIRTPQRQDRINGLAAFDAWREHLLNDEAFEDNDLAVLRERLYVHLDATDVIAEGRWYAHNFCRLAADELADHAESLWKASACFDAQHTLIWEMWKAMGGNGRSEDAAHRLADRGIREACAAMIERARDLDARAAGHLEKVVG